MNKFDRPGDVDLVIEATWRLQPIFLEIYERWAQELNNPAQAERQMWQKFNNGIGFVLGVDRRQVTDVLAKLPDGKIIGTVRWGTGRVSIRSGYSGRLVEF